MPTQSSNFLSPKGVRTVRYKPYEQHVLVCIYYTPEGKANADALMGKYEQELREEVAWWLGSSAMLAHRIDPNKVYLQCQEGRSRSGDISADITIAITGSVTNNRERKLKIALEEIHGYLRGYPVYQVSLFVRIEIGDTFVAMHSKGEPFVPMKKRPIRHWRQEMANKSND